VAPDDDLAEAAGDGPRRDAGKRPFIHPAAVLPGLVLACAVAGFAAYGAFLPDYARDAGMSGAGILFGLYALVSLLVRIFGARLPELLGPRRAVTIALGNIGLGLAVLALTPSTLTLCVASALLGLGVAFNYPSLMALTVNRASDRDRAVAVSSFTMFFEIGSAAGGLAIGALAEVVGKQQAFLGAVVFAVVGIWLLRTKVVPPGAPDGGPTSRMIDPPHFIPVAGD
jgi:MFS family permease